MTWLGKLLSKLFSIREQSDGDVVKPFLDHLEDLRVMIFKMGGVLIGGMVVAFFFRDDLMRLVKAPLDKENLGLELVSFELTEGFMISLKLAFYAGIVLSFPFLLWFLAGFILPALTRKEKRLILPGVMGGFVLFCFGVVASYEYILPRTIHWFADYTKRMQITMVLQARTYFSFVANLSLAAGLMCELPVVVLALSALGLVSFKLLSSTRPYAITIILILVAILAPSPDPFTFMTLAIPVLSIYELCIWIVWLMERRRAKNELS
jgi:sec-independent protein translocase protein TatC